MSAPVAERCSSPEQGIAACIVPTARSRVRPCKAQIATVAIHVADELDFAVSCAGGAGYPGNANQLVPVALGMEKASLPYQV